MKNNNLKKWSIAYMIFFVLFTSTIFAQNAFNITGTFEGLRSQLNSNHTAFAAEFQYKYDLVQKGDAVEGVSTIIGVDGNYAEVQVKGVVVKDKFYFEEYRVLDQIQADNMAWCYKFGVLDISKVDGEIILSGYTPSAVINYNRSCTGGYTKISALDEDTDKRVSSKKGGIVSQDNFAFNIYPNPALDNTSYSFELTEDSKFKVSIMDMTGRFVMKPVVKKASKGIYTEKLDLSGYTAGMYVVKIQIGNKVYSKELLKVAH